VRRSRGFTLVEMLVVVVLGTVVAAGLYRVLTTQQRAVRHQNEVASVHDVFRVAAAVLAADLREANPADGDLGGLSPETLSVRSPVGFAVVCAVDTVNARLGLVGVRGRVDATPGDSLLVYRPAGWIVRAVTAVDPGGLPPLACPYAGGPPLERTVRVAGSVSGVPVGAPARAFRRTAYHLAQDAGFWWLARTDPGGTEPLVGPTAPGGLLFLYVDTLEQPAASVAAVARVDVRLVARSRAGSGGLAGAGRPLEDTLWVRVRTRNR
jgi:prepilin-type N-terminal cleavage/methylation domain-containing protein